MLQVWETVYEPCLPKEEVVFAEVSSSPEEESVVCRAPSPHDSKVAGQGRPVVLDLRREDRHETETPAQEISDR